MSNGYVWIFDYVQMPRKELVKDVPNIMELQLEVIIQSLDLLLLSL